MDQQIVAYISHFLSSIPSGFRQGYSAQNTLVRILENFRTSLDEGSKVGALLMDLSQEFECIRHGLLIAKLHTYGFSHEALTPVSNYLKNRKQWV